MTKKRNKVRRAKKKKKPAPTSNSPQQRGFDFGVPGSAAALSSFDFVDNLTKAHIIGVSYGLDFSTALGFQIPMISLIGQHQEPLKAAFEQFTDWAEHSNGDAIELVFVFLKDGSYKLCVSPEPSSLIRRSIGYGSIFDPIALQATWIKSIDTTSNELVELRKHLTKGIRPFLLTATAHSKPVSKLSIPSRADFKSINHGTQILKFDIKFIDEDDDSLSSMDSFYRDMALRKKPYKKKTGGKHPPKSVVWKNRQQNLKELFPVTIWGGLENELLQQCRSELLKKGARGWQVDQALCNLVLSLEICSEKLHYPNVPTKAWPSMLIDHISNRYETASTLTNIGSAISVTNLTKQIELDSTMLLNIYGIKPTNKKMPNLIRQLESENLLEAEEQ